MNTRSISWPTGAAALPLRACKRAALTLPLLAGSVLWNSAASAQTPDFGLKTIVNQAIDSPVGQAEATFQAELPWVRAIRQRAGLLPGPITVRATVVQRWRSPGCARVRNDFSFTAGYFNDATKSIDDRSFFLELNICKNGDPPIESVDLRDVQALQSDKGNSSFPVRPIPVAPYKGPLPKR
jgi:hypothetical protein